MGPDFAHHCRIVSQETIALLLNRRGQRLSVRGASNIIRAVADMLGHARLDTVRLYTRPSAADRERALNLLPYDR